MIAGPDERIGLDSRGRQRGSYNARRGAKAGAQKTGPNDRRSLAVVRPSCWQCSTHDRQLCSPCDVGLAPGFAGPRDEAREGGAALDNTRAALFRIRNITTTQLALRAISASGEMPLRTVTQRRYPAPSGLNDVPISARTKSRRPAITAPLFNLGQLLWHSDSSFLPFRRSFR